MRLINLRVFMATIRSGLADAKTMAAAKDHYGLPQECTDEDLMESIKDDCAATTEQMYENMKK